MALDTIYNHPNVAPFISRQLIQQFTASNPEPAYIERVARIFESGVYATPGGKAFGNGVRGDLQATLAAILMDESLYTAGPKIDGMSTRGKIREPVLRVAHWARAFNVRNIEGTNEIVFRDTASPTTLSQHPFRSASVFNFYRAGYVSPGSLTGEMGFTAPELQILDGTSAIGYFNFATDLVFENSRQYNQGYNTYEPDYTYEFALTNNLPGLIDHLDTLLTGQRMSDDEIDEVLFILEALPIDNSNEDRETADRDEIVKLAIALVMNSPAYAVVW